MDQKLYDTKLLPGEKNYDAPDHSEIRLLLDTNRAGLCHCTLLPQSISLAGVHATVEEFWYCIQGLGQFWRKQGVNEEVVDVFPGVCLSIPPQTHFQFRNNGWEQLCFIIATIPPWPGEQEWVEVANHWLTT